MNDLQVFVGYDARYRAAWQVCAASMQAHAGDYPVSIASIGREQLQQQGLYTRATETREGRRFDVLSGEYCSTDFSLARFWVPYVAGRAGWALFCDCDFLWRADVRAILDHADPKYAVMVVPNRHDMGERAGADGASESRYAGRSNGATIKMGAQAQTYYFRKNWSSLMLWNLAHAGSHRPNLHDLNHWHKHDLHGLRWLAEIEIGFLPQEWNHLVGVAETEEREKRKEEREEPKAVHFTLGTPDMPGYESQPYADEWRSYLPQKGAA